MILFKQKGGKAEKQNIKCGQFREFSIEMYLYLLAYPIKGHHQLSPICTAGLAESFSTGCPSCFQGTDRQNSEGSCLRSGH